MKRVLFCFLFSLALVSCDRVRPSNRARTHLPPPPTNTAVQDDYAIYTELLPMPPVAAVHYVIQQTTILHPIDLTRLPQRVFPALRDDTLADFNEQNLQGHPLNQVFNGPDQHYVLVNWGNYYEKPTADNGLRCSWMREACFNKAKFQAEYPQAPGITWLSAIGYNADRTQALVAMLLDDGQDSWTVQVFLLAKVAGQWQVIDRYDQYHEIV